MKTFNTIETRKAMQKKYGRYTLSVEILERAVGEQFLKDILQQYEVAFEKKHPAQKFESLQHEEVYKMHKQGKSIETICDVFNLPKSRFWEAVAIGCERANEKK